MNLTNEESLLSLEKTISSVNGIYIGSENNKNLFYFSNVVTVSGITIEVNGVSEKDNEFRVLTVDGIVYEVDVKFDKQKYNSVFALSNKQGLL